MREHDVDRLLDLEKLEDVVGPDMVDGPDLVGVVRQRLAARLVVVVALVDAAEAADAEGADLEDVRGAEVVNVWSHPAAMESLWFVMSAALDGWGAETYSSAL